jgi:chromosome segregation ATPase
LAWTANTAPAIKQENAQSPPQTVGEALAAPEHSPVARQPELTSNPPKEHRGGLFRGKRELEAELERLQGHLDALGFTERIALQAQLADLRSEVPKLAAERDALWSQVQPLRAELVSLRNQLELAQKLLARVGELEATQFKMETAIAQMQPITNQSAPQIGLTELTRQISEAS